MKIHFYKFCFFLIPFLVGCKSINPLVPIDNIIEPKIAPPKVSYVNIPIEISLKSHYSEAEKSIPKSFSGKEKSCEGLSYEYILSRDAITFATNSTGLDFSTNLKYSLDLSYCPKCTALFNEKGNCVVPRFYGSCGKNEPLRNAYVSFSSIIELNSNFKLKSKTTLKELTLIDPCKITIVNYDITTLLDKEIRGQASTIEKEIDAEMSKIDLRTACNNAWLKLQEGIPVDQYGFLYFSPKSIGVNKLNYQNNKVNFNLGIEMFPKIQTEKLPLKALDLPNLSAIKSNEGFELMIDLSLSYDSLNNWMTKQFRNTEFFVKNRKIIIDSLRFIGANESRILTELNFHGFRKGKLFLSAQPILDPKKQIIQLKEIEFDIKTRDVLIKTAKWLLNKKITSFIEAKAIYDLKRDLIEIKKIMENSLNQDLDSSVHMRGLVDNLELYELYPLKNKLFLRSKINGKLKLILE